MTDFSWRKKVCMLHFNLIMKLSLCTPDFDSFSFVLSNVEMPCHASLVSQEVWWVIVVSKNIKVKAFFLLSNYYNGITLSNYILASILCIMTWQTCLLTMRAKDKRCWRMTACCYCLSLLPLDCSPVRFSTVVTQQNKNGIDQSTKWWW